jgi:hypothetical protein
MQTNHSRVMSFQKYQNYCTTFGTAAQFLLQANRSKKALKLKTGLSRKQQSYWSGFVNRLWSKIDMFHQDLLQVNPSARLKAPIILFGDGCPSSMRGQRSTNPTWLLDYLKRFFTVLVVNENYSSQTCPKCWGGLDYHNKGVRVKTCPNPSCRAQPRAFEASGTESDSTGNTDELPPTVPFVVNRDIAAPVNFLAIAIGLVMNGTRPEPFRRREQPQEDDEEDVSSAAKEKGKKSSTKKQSKKQANTKTTGKGNVKS